MEQHHPNRIDSEVFVRMLKNLLDSTNTNKQHVESIVNSCNSKELKDVVDNFMVALAKCTVQDKIEKERSPNYVTALELMRVVRRTIRANKQLDNTLLEVIKQYLLTFDHQAQMAKGLYNLKAEVVTIEGRLLQGSQMDGKILVQIEQLQFAIQTIINQLNHSNPQKQ